MPYNLLILPLVGGFFILSQFLFFKHSYSKLSSQQLLFNAIFAGIWILILSLLARAVIINYYPHFSDRWYHYLNGFFDIERNPANRYLWTLSAGLIAVVIITMIANGVVLILEKIARKKFHIINAINKHGSELEKLFLDSVTGDGYLVQITLKNDKVYIGGLVGFREPRNISYLKFRPVYSGYRNQETKKLTITTYYPPALSLYKKNDSATGENLIENVVIILKVEEILSANPFYPKIFIAFKKMQEAEEEKDKLRD